MTTLLEYVLTEYLGEPIKRRGNGESYWHCPICDSSGFHSMPDKPQFKHRAYCLRCQFMEDVEGMLKEIHSGNYAHWKHLPNYNDRQILFTKLERNWKQEQRRGRGGKSNVNTRRS